MTSQEDVGQEGPVSGKLRAEILADNLVETVHQATIQGEQISYTAVAGRMILKEEYSPNHSPEDFPKDYLVPKAALFFVAYTRRDIQNRENRPITFSFNGGPGSSSVWLHMGLLGPKRVWMDEEGVAPPPPYKLVENEYSLLDKTDLVFIDPVSTGYSRVIPGGKADEFHGFSKDIETVGEFIRLFISRYKRWASPKFLIGESYGTTRAAGLSGYLQERHGMYLNGILLISTVLSFQTGYFNPENDLPPLLFLPSYAAAAWYHQCLSSDLQSKPLRSLLDEVESFAAGEYASALFQGTALKPEVLKNITAKLSRYTGLSKNYIEQTNLRINIFQFCKELLREKKRTIGRLDARFEGIDRTAVGEEFEFDPSYTNIQGPYTALLNHYLRVELQYETDLPYEILTDRVRPWSYKEHENRYVDVSETLRKAMSMNPYLKVYFANGYFDLATPYFATEYTVNHLGLDPELHSNITFGYFEAGHMMYIHLPSLKKLRDEMVAFLASAQLLA